MNEAQIIMFCAIQRAVVETAATTPNGYARVLAQISPASVTSREIVSSSLREDR
jgi:hypothetical protein